MSHFPDTSFLYPLYRTDVHSSKVDAFLAAGHGPLRVSTLLLLELRQSTRLQVRLHSANRSLGFPKADADRLLQQVQGDLAQAVLEIASVDWADVHRIAERLSATHTETQGHRLVDILHVATALHLGASEFLTFDAGQRKLAEAEGMKIPV